MTDKSPRSVDRPTLIKLSGVTKKFGAFEALKPIELSIQEGEFVSVVGPSGCG